MDNNKPSNFIDPKTILAVVLVGVFWFGWQSYLNKKYPHMNDPHKDSTSTAQETGASTNANAATASASALHEDGKTGGGSEKRPESVLTEVEKTQLIQSSQASFELSSHGMGLKNLKLNHYTRRDQTPIEFARDLPQGLFELHLLNDPQPISFTIESKSENVFDGVAHIGGMTILRHIVYSPDTFSFQNKISVIHPEASFRGLTLEIPERKEAGSSGGFLSGNYDHQEVLYTHDGNKLETVNVTSAKDNIDKSQGQVSIISVASQYFSAATIDKSELAPEAQVSDKLSDNYFLGRLNYKVGSPRDQMDFNFVSYAGPKSHEILEKADPELGSIIDLGFFGAIGRVLLIILKWFNVYLNNWGLSIIALTLLVRGVVAPFNIASYKSMKKMQKIQPKMKALRERYKDDPQTQQRETMALMKQEKVNPLGGCLPMLLQMPIFFALFRTLGQSIDLYQAPFFGWIHDLSLKDPFYILPVLVGATFFIQQKITPTTMDPQQAKIMQFMPIMFTFFMISLPSGLTLYTFVSTLFGILLQRFFMRDRQALAAVREAKA